MTRRIVWSVERTPGHAEQQARMLRDMGRNTRIYKRTVRAEAITVLVYVVVTDEVVS